MTIIIVAIIVYIVLISGILGMTFRNTRTLPESRHEIGCQQDFYCTCCKYDDIH